MKANAPKNSPAAEHDTVTAAFLKEVDEALQYERLMHLWHRSKYVMLAAGLGLLVVVAGAQGWKAYQAHQARGMAERWHAWTQISSDTTRRVQLSNFAKSANGGYKALAVFTQAELAATPQAKAEAYKRVAEDGSQPEWLQNLARFNQALVLLGSDDATAKSQLELLTQEGKQQTATYAPALEQLAILAQRQKDSTAARGYTGRILELPSDTLPPDLRQRARQRLGELSTIAN